MEENKPLIRPVITPKDIANITGCSLEAATSRYKRLRVKLKKTKGQEVTYEEYCLHADIREERVIPFLRVSPANLLKLAIAATLFTAFSSLPLLKYTSKYFREHDMVIDGRDVDYVKAHTFEYDSVTKKSERLDIKIEVLPKK